MKELQQQFDQIQLGYNFKLSKTFNPGGNKHLLFGIISNMRIKTPRRQTLEGGRNLRS